MGLERGGPFTVANVAKVGVGAAAGAVFGQAFAAYWWPPIDRFLTDSHRDWWSVIIGLLVGASLAWLFVWRTYRHRALRDSISVSAHVLVGVAEIIVYVELRGARKYAAKWRVMEPEIRMFGLDEPVTTYRGEGGIACADDLLLVFGRSLTSETAVRLARERHCRTDLWDMQRLFFRTNHREFDEPTRPCLVRFTDDLVKLTAKGVPA